MNNYILHYNPYSFYTNVNGVILIGSDGVGVSYPSYIMIVSLLIRNSLLLLPGQLPVIDLTSAQLEQLKPFVEMMPYAARDIYGTPVTSQFISEETIFVNPLLSQATQPLLPPANILGNNILGELFRSAFYLNIPPLINAFASAIADRIQRVRVNELIDLGFGNFTPQMLKYIRKYDILKRSLHVEELTIADYIGLNGQPNNQGGYVNLSNKGLTSLQGINLILNPDTINTLLLSDNFILGIHDPNYPPGPFLLMANLQSLFLGGNYLNFIPVTFLRGLDNLQTISLISNFLTTLAVEVFSGLTQLQEIYLSNNQISRLPVGIFAGLPSLQEINLEDNPIEETEQEFKELHHLPAHVVVEL